MRVRASLAAVVIGALAITTMVSRLSRADVCTPRDHVSTCVDADELWPHAGPGPFFAIGSTTTTPKNQLSIDVVASWLSQPVGLRVVSANPGGTTIFAINDAVDLTMLFAWGITDRLELTMAAPMTLYEDGDGTADVRGTDQPLSRSALRDLRFGTTIGLVAPPRVGPPRGFGLAARLEFAAPTGSSNDFARGRTATFAPTLAASYRRGPWLGSAELGARVRGITQVGEANVGSAMTAALGAAFEVLGNGRLTLAAEAFAQPSLVGQSPNQADVLNTSTHALAPAEWIASATTMPFLGGDLGFTLGGGGPIPLTHQASITEPRFRFDFAIRYAPTGRDTDGDGIPDAIDKCPNEPEDFDGFQDADGCPDPDNDKDGIPDVVDKCPNNPETFNGYQDADGCPDEVPKKPRAAGGPMSK